MKKHSRIVLTGTVIMLAAISFKTVIGMVRSVLIGRTLGASALGTFTLAYTIFQLLSILSMFGFYQTINRIQPELHAKNKKKEIKILLGTSLKFTTSLSIIIFAVFFLVSPALSSFFGDGALKNELKIILIGLPFFNLTRILVGYATSYETTKFQALVESIIMPFLGIAILFILQLMGYTTHIISIAFVASYILSFSITLFLARLTAIKNLPFITSLKHFDPKYIYYAFPLFLNMLLVFVMRWSDTFALGYFEDSKTVGIYNIALLLAQIPTLLQMALNTIFLPTISRLATTGKFSDGVFLYKNTVRIITFLTLPYIFFLITFDQEALRIFGDEFSIHTLLIPILCLGSFAQTFSGPVDITLTALDQRKLVSINTVIAFIINIIANLTLIPHIGVLGAAIANASAIIIQNFLGIIELFIMKQFLPYSKKTILFVFGGTLIGIVLVAFRNSIDTSDLENLPLAHLVMALFAFLSFFYIIYFLFIIVFKLFERNDGQIIDVFYKRLRKRNEK